MRARIVRRNVDARRGGVHRPRFRAGERSRYRDRTLNVAKSTFSPGPGATSGTVTLEAAGQGIHVVADIVDAKGFAQHTEYTGNCDGKDNPITGVAGVDMVSLKRIDATSTRSIDKKAGKVVQTWDRKVSADGKTLTVTQNGTDAEGQTVKNVLAFARK